MVYYKIPSYKIPRFELLQSSVLLHIISRLLLPGKYQAPISRKTLDLSATQKLTPTPILLWPVRTALPYALPTGRAMYNLIPMTTLQ
jgi:hypothetical protein